MSLNVRVSDAALVADGVRQLTLTAASGAALPAVEPGAHVVVHTPAGHRRAYSITERTPAGAYVIAVARSASGGGSDSVHDDVRLGDRLVVDEPRNAFPLVDAPSYVLVAGGIGITPIRAMYHALRGRVPVQLIYLFRRRAEAAYVAELDGADGVTLHESTSQGRFDLWSVLGDAASTRHLYYCASRELMDEVRALTMHWDPTRLHAEDFAGVEVTGGAPFTVRWAPDGRLVEVGGNESLLGALRRADVGVDSSCESGTCGTCVLRLHDGDVEHRDLVLDEAERSTRVVSCVSRGVGTVVVGPVTPG